MPTDYEAIRRANEEEYGKGIPRYGRTLLADRYDDRTHFIFEILQNVEDALKKRGEWNGNRSVEFSLSSDGVTISHFGIPFDEADVRGVCGIAESTKAELTAIGRFGVGFKSVYAFTDNPEIHSGDEHFTIESYVWPRTAQERSLKPEETIIYLPFRSDEPSAKEDILDGLRRLGLRTLLFLREIEEISWSVDDGISRVYLRDAPEYIGDGIRKVMLVGQDADEDDVSEEWIVFSRPVSNDGTNAGHVEIAFNLGLSDDDGDSQSVQPVVDSPLVVFFPTILPTSMDFVVQGPYRTTPSRDNVPGDDPWNRYLVEETTALMEDALVGLRELDLLDVAALQCLPIEKSRFPPGNRFAPLFQAVRESLRTKPLLPAHGGGHVAGENAKLARTQAVRDLIDPEQLSALFSQGDELVWLSGEITPDRTHNLHEYLTSQLKIGEITSDWLVRRLDTTFLEAQSDAWIELLYEFLNDQRGIFQRLRVQDPPLVRLEGGSHITFNDASPNAYLPSNVKTDYPTVKGSVCQSDDARAFLEFFGLRVPAAVDDVITNVLPKYCADQVDVSDCDYRSDIDRILVAYDTDSKSQQRDLLFALKETKFVATVDTGSHVSQFVRPNEAYLATENLKNLFEDVPGVLMVDDSKDCLQGEPINNLLKDVGTPMNLLPVKVEPPLTDDEKRELMRYSTRELEAKNYTLKGLDSLLVTLAKLPIDQAADRATLLWDALCDVRNAYRDDNSDWPFSGIYRWYYYTEYGTHFPARFVKILTDTAWVPDKNGALRLPCDVIFEETGWKENPFLQEKIQFKPEDTPEVPDVVNILAKESGFETAGLLLLKEAGVTTEAQMKELLARAGLLNERDTTTEAQVREHSGELHSAPGAAHIDLTPEGEASTNAPTLSASEQPDVESGLKDDDRSGDETPSTTRATSSSGSAGTRKQPSSSAGSSASGTRSVRESFVSYIAVSPDETDEDSDDTQYQGRMSLEAQAIDHIVSIEPALQRTPWNTPGYDLIEPGQDGEPVRLVEVKAMKGVFDDRPVTMTSTQFKLAQKYQYIYWLYVVENAGNPEQRRIIRIKDPAGKAQTFTFDHGWAQVAENPA